VAKQVRNHVAHEIEITDFSNQDVVGDCMGLHYPKLKAASTLRGEVMGPATRFL
jgi:hypothetical protein